MPQPADWMSDPPPQNLTSWQQFTRNVDWANTALGPMKDWDSTLRTMAHLVLLDPDPATLVWGDSQTFLYNEAYAPCVGECHPKLQGGTPYEVLGAQTWAPLDKLTREAQATGQTLQYHGRLVPLYRYGFWEETWFDFKYIPVYGEGTECLGIYAVVADKTRENILERRTKTLQTLAGNLASVASKQDLWPAILTGLEGNAYDAPVALVYSVDDSEYPVTPASESPPGAIGVEAGHPFAPRYLELGVDFEDLAAQVRVALQNSNPSLLKTADGSLPAALLKDIDWRGHADPSTSAVIYPLRSASSKVYAFVLIALNPQRPYDEAYQNFIRSIAETVSAPQVQFMLSTEELRQSEHDKEQLSHQLLIRTEQFKKSERRFTQFADRAAIGLSILDTAGRIIFANETWCTMSSQPRESVGATFWEESFIEEDRTRLNQILREIMQGKHAVHFQARLGTSNLATSIGAGGQDEERVRIALCTAYPELDLDGSIKAIVSCATDVTELQRIHNQLEQRSRELEKEKEKYRKFADSAPVGLGIYTSSLDLDYVNGTFCTITGVTKDDLNTLVYEELVYPEDFQGVKDMFAGLYTTTAVSTFQIRVKRKGRFPAQGQEVLSVDCLWVLASCFAEFADDGSVDRIITWITDISIQKAAEEVISKRMDEALQMKKQLEGFIDMTSHEMRNPLSAIVQCTDAISDSLDELRNWLPPLPEDQANLVIAAADAARTIALCATHQKSIVDDILTLSKLNSNLVSICPTETDATATVQQALDMFASEFQAHDIKCHYVIEDSIAQLKAQRFWIDSSRLLQIIINLITNAIKFTKKEPLRSIVVILSVADENPDGHILEKDDGFTYFPSGPADSDLAPLPQTAEGLPGETLYPCFGVQDTGCGMTKEEMGRLFERFTQASVRTYSKYGGSGLEPRGESGQSSHCSNSSTSSVKRRRTPSASTPEPKLFEQSLELLPKSPPEKKQHLSILLVEDNMINQNVMKKVGMLTVCKSPNERQKHPILTSVIQQLVKLGHNVQTASNGLEALRYLQTTRYWIANPNADQAPDLDVTLMDVEMPEMDGLSATRKIREYQRDRAMIGSFPIIAITANARGEQVQQAKEAGMDDVVTKPFKISELMAKIDAFMGRIGDGQDT
ncbi:hypothetical protein LTS18_014792 [Coniosporium uncinatum]|uniref:Uncharacterized protein n=1 Tax=Coniosporium uncinatum TaxID=93489 RepID=A0ACC3D8S7_9PEZI|nr:hypothetical protein LTS18_014792 [Coniosporium uncinatum]